jgi:rare lipoprotein A
MCDPAWLTVTHRTLPFGTKVRVTNVINGQSVVVRIADLGQYRENESELAVE